MKGKGITTGGPKVSGFSAGQSRARALNTSSEKRGKGGSTLKVTGAKGMGESWKKGKR